MGSLMFHQNGQLEGERFRSGSAVHTVTWGEKRSKQTLTVQKRLCLSFYEKTDLHQGKLV